MICTNYDLHCCQCPDRKKCDEPIDPKDYPKRERI